MSMKHVDALPEDLVLRVSQLGVLAALGLTFLYLLAPLFFFVQLTAISWALAGLVTLFVGLRLQSRTFLFTAFAVQLLGGALFLLRLQGAGEDSAAVFSAGSARCTAVS